MGKSALLLARFHADFPAYDIDVTATETIEQIALQCYYKYVVVNFRHYAFVILYAVAPAVLSHRNGLAEQRRYFRPSLVDCCLLFHTNDYCPI